MENKTKFCEGQWVMDIDIVNPENYKSGIIRNIITSKVCPNSFMYVIEDKAGYPYYIVYEEHLIPVTTENTEKFFNILDEYKKGLTEIMNKRNNAINDLIKKYQSLE